MLIDKRIKYFKLNRINKRKFLIISILFLVFILTPFLNNLNINQSFNENEQKYIKDEDIVVQNLKTQDLTTDNIFSGIGAPWNVSHWANRTDYNTPVDFENGASYTVNMDLGIGWEGYQLNGTIKDLYDKREWTNGTFNCGDDDGWSDPSISGFPTWGNDDNDTLSVLNWTFNNVDINPGGSGSYWNHMYGNYYDGQGSDGDPVSTKTYLSLNMFGGQGVSGQRDDYYFQGYDHNDRCWWETTFNLTRGKVADGEISFWVYPESEYNPQDPASRTFGTHWHVQSLINDELITSIDLISLDTQGGGSDWVKIQYPLTKWLNDKKVFPDNGLINLKIQLIRAGPTYSASGYGGYNRVLIDNVSLIVKAEAKPEQIELEMNDISVSDIDWGNGTVGQIDSWTTPPVDVKFDTSEVRPPEMGGYEVEFKTDLNLFARKMSDDSDYIPNFAGNTFEVRNDSSVEWECYARVSVPTGYKETNMTIKFPEDVNITWISNAEYPDTNILERDCDNSTLGILKVFNFSETPDGFWRVKGISPNYCSNLKIYNNVSNSWFLNNTFLSGQYINITGNIGSPIGLDISSYIENTQARLYIRFPNGSLWSTKTQTKLVNDTGWVYFDPILIPNVSPNYEAGEYEVIISWNNSYSSFELNETGVIYKKFTVIHDSTLQPDQGIYFIENVVDDRVINIKVSYNDLIDNTAIENALVYTNFSGTRQYFSEISPGFYLFEFNATKANAGNNTLTVYANSTYYLNKVINITVEVVKETLLTVESDFFTVPWKQNFTVRFNYTEKNNPTIGINTTDISNDWLGDYHLNQVIEGQYVLTCNTSAYDALTLQSFIISVHKYKYESQSVLIRVQINELESSLKLFVNGDLVNSSDTIQVEIDDTINVTVYYRDSFMQQHLSNANISLLGVGDLNEINNQYTIIIDADDLGQGITALTIFAQLANYESQSINFFISVVEKSTNLQLFLNGEETLTPVFNLTIGEILNVTVRYMEQTGAYIPNVTLQLLSEGIPTNFTRDDVLEQHYIQLNNLNLKIGVNLYSIVARTTDYEIQTKNLIITVNRISTSINLSSQINAEPGDDVLIQVTLNNLDFGGTITNATVTYAWAYRQGELLDPEMDGTYEILLENVPEGNYPITITAFAGENYDFTGKEITLIVSSPTVSPGPDLNWLIFVLIGGIFGLVMVFTLYQTHYKYPPMVRKIRKLRKNIGKGKKTKPIITPKRKEIIDKNLQDKTHIFELELKINENKINEKVEKSVGDQNLKKIK